MTPGNQPVDLKYMDKTNQFLTVIELLLLSVEITPISKKHISSIFDLTYQRLLLFHTSKPIQEQHTHSLPDIHYKRNMYKRISDIKL